jgi:hypothetical protein
MRFILARAAAHSGLQKALFPTGNAWNAVEGCRTRSRGDFGL